MRSLIKIAILLCILVAGCYYYFFGTNQVYERTSFKMLGELQAIVSSNNIQGILGGLAARINDNAGIHLEIHSTPPGQKETVQSYNLNKPQFMNYIKSLLNYTKNYSFVPAVTNVTYRDEVSSEVVEFKTRIEADRVGEWGDKVHIHYAVDTVCGANVVNATENKTISLLNGETNPTKLGSFSCMVYLQSSSASVAR
jgi:hypothetical protein